MVQWVFANYYPDVAGEPGVFEYYVSTPEEWSEVDKQRVRKHFQDFNLAKRYSTKAAEQLGIVMRQIHALDRFGMDSGAIQSSILQPGIEAAPFVNHWQMGMYQALSDYVMTRS